MKKLILAAALIAFAAGAHAKPMYEYVDSSHLAKAQSTDFPMGNPEAPVIMIEYASLSCPHCGKFHKHILPELKKKYIDTGKLLYILRPYPINDPALKAALLIDCVGENMGAQRYNTFAKVLFEGQNKWAFDASWVNALATFAKVGGVSNEMFDSCTTDSAREIKLLKIKQHATKELGVNHTPYFFINSRRFDAEVTVENMTAYIDGLLENPAVKGPSVKPEAKP